MNSWLKQMRLNDLTNDAAYYLENNYFDPTKPREKPKVSFSEGEEIRYSLRTDSYNRDSIQDAIRKFHEKEARLLTLNLLEENTNMSFVDKMLEYINKKQLRDSKVYKAAQIDRRLFSKIVSDREYKPAKDTCIAICFALQLSLRETNDLLARAGYILSHSSKRDVVIEYFFREGVYDLMDVNIILQRLGLKIIGRF